MPWGRVPFFDVRVVALLNLKARRHDPRPGTQTIAVLASIGAEVELEPELCGLNAEVPVRLDEAPGRFPGFGGVARLEPLVDVLDGVYWRGSRRSMSFWWMMPRRRRNFSVCPFA